jgi:DNA-binding transcriptional ArsR family regulator
MATDEEDHIDVTGANGVTGEELLRNYITAMTDPTRGIILMELAHAGELTPTQLAKRLALTANNVYHHMRVLRGLGVVDPPRAVARETYVEKYYRITPELVKLTGSDPSWLDRAQANMSLSARKSLMVGMYLTAARMLTRAAQRYEAMDDALFEEIIFKRQLGMVSLNDMTRERLVGRLAALRGALSAEHEASVAAGDEERTVNTEQDMVIMASLPLIWDDEDEAEGK